MKVEISTERIDFGEWTLHFKISNGAYDVKYIFSDPYNQTFETWEKLYTGVDIEITNLKLKNGIYYLKGDTGIDMEVPKEYMEKPLRIAIENAMLKEYEFAKQ